MLKLLKFISSGRSRKPVVIFLIDNIIVSESQEEHFNEYTIVYNTIVCNRNEVQ